MKQETLEEASLLSRPIHLIWDEDERYDCNEEFREEFKKGAKWQQERSYSEEEVIELLQKALTHKDDGEIGSLVTAQGEIRPANFFSWFNKFKNK